MLVDGPPNNGGTVDMSSDSAVTSQEEPIDITGDFDGFSYNYAYPESLMKNALHNKLTENFHKCPYCVYSSHHKGNLRKHVATHTGEKPFECSECRKTFTLKHHLQRHFLTHIVKKQFRCKNCDQIFQQQTELQEHEVIHK